MNKHIFALRSLIYRIKNFKVKEKVVYNKDKWAKEAQKGELEFHLKNEWRNTQDFTDQSKKLFDGFGFNEDEYSNKNVLDLGAGSKLRSKYFKNSKLYVIEPLADKFMGNIEWCDLKDAKKVYSTPAEERILELERKMDLIISINVLDHCYNFKEIISNLNFYLKEGGTIFLSFDKHDIVDEMHPLILNEKICAEIFEDCGLKAEKISKGTSLFKTYGHGEYCINYWLSK